MALDGRVVVFWALTTLLAAVAAGLAPAVRGARVDLSDAFRSADRSSGTGFRGAHARRLRDGLLVVEAAFAVVLIVGASLLARSFVRLMAVDNGYTADGVLIASVELPRGATEARTDQFIERALARLRAMRGVSAAGAGAMIPLMSRTADPALHAAGFRQPVGSPRRDGPLSIGLRPAMQRRSACACERDGSSSTPMRVRAGWRRSSTRNSFASTWPPGR